MTAAPPAGCLSIRRGQLAGIRRPAAARVTGAPQLLREGVRLPRQVFDSTHRCLLSIAP
jgi:hypothetical protein